MPLIRRCTAAMASRFGQWAGTLGWGQGARRGFVRACRLGAGRRAPWALLAHAQAQRGRWAAAYRWQRRAVAQDPQRASAHYNLGYLADRLHDPVAAERAFRGALALAPAMDLAWYGLGRCLQAQGRLSEALLAFQENSRLQPWSPSGWEAVAQLQVALGLPEAARQTVSHLGSFEPKVAQRLQRELALTVDQGPHTS